MEINDFDDLVIARTNGPSLMIMNHGDNQGMPNFPTKYAEKYLSKFNASRVTTGLHKIYSISNDNVVQSTFNFTPPPSRFKLLNKNFKHRN